MFEAGAVAVVTGAGPGMGRAIAVHLDLPLITPRGLVRPRSATFGEPLGL